jgi:hypothetical protein
MPVNIPALDTAAIGAPLTRAGISLIPVYLHGDTPPALSTDTSALTVTEAPQASVPTLVITSTTDLPTLITEGEVLRGGQQDRVVNTSVLVPARAALEVPVSCVEHGRWGGEREFGRSARYASRRVRRAKNASVANNVRNEGSKRSNQGLVWNTVAHEVDRLGAVTQTGTFLAAEAALEADARLRDARDEVARLGPLPGQRGVVITHGRRVVSCDLFASTDVLAAHWQGLVASWFLDALEVGDTRRPGLSPALRFVRRLGSLPGDTSPGVGLGTEVYLRDNRIAGQLLLADGAVVHASAFALAA